MATETTISKRRKAEIHAWPLNIFLIRQDLRDASKIFGDLGQLTHIPLLLPDLPEESIGVGLYYSTRTSERPKWAPFFGDLLEDTKLPRVSTAPAVLIVPVDGRLMAVTFSYGSALLEPGTIDPTFGLRTALNSIKPGKVRSYDKRTFDALFRQTREQAARETKLESFGIDAERDLVRTVSGKPENKLLGTSMSGSKSIHTSMRTAPDRLIPDLRRLLNQSTLDTYKKEYPWLGYIEEILDQGITRTLDSYLDDCFQEGKDAVWLAVPEIIDRFNSSDYHFILPNKCKSVYSDITIENLCKACGCSVADLTVDFLRGHRVEMLDGNDSVLKRWSLYDCLNVELVVGQENYVLSSSVWYRVDSNLLKEVDREIESLEIAAVPFPDYEDKNEYDFNCRTAALSPSRLCCLDTEEIMFGGGKSRFELCDLLESTGALVHVKRYGGSSALSHLFAQGLISAELLVKRPGFRESADQLVKRKGFVLDPGRDFGSKPTREVVYVIIGAPPCATRHQLPLFSRVNFRNAARGIRAFGWDVKIQYVDETDLHKKLSRAKSKKSSSRLRK